MPASELIERTATLIAELDAQSEGACSSELAALDRRLHEPVRVAVIGRVKAGKSTLVNALLGQRVAPTDVSECTQVVTWFHYGQPERVEIHLRDGTQRDTQLGTDGMLPRSLGVDVDQVDALHVHLANESLRSFTLIDTPGLGSTSASYSEATRRLLAGAADTGTADATVLLLNDSLLRDEVDALDVFRTQAGPAGSAANAVGVLTRVDQLDHEPSQVFEVAVDLADRFLDVLDSAVAAVVPVAGLIAETAETAALLETDATNVATLATLDESSRRRMLRTPDRFVAADAPIGPAERERLWSLLDRAGIAWALDAVEGDARGAIQIRRELSARSGIAGVKRTLVQTFATRDHVLKVRSVLDELVRLSYTDVGNLAVQHRLRAAVEEIKLDAVMHPVAELEAWHGVCTGRITVDNDTRDELRRLFTAIGPAARCGLSGDAPPEAVRDHARARMAAWRTFMVTKATPDEAHLARTVMRSYRLLWDATV